MSWVLLVVFGYLLFELQVETVLSLVDVLRTTSTTEGKERLFERLVALVLRWLTGRNCLVARGQRWDSPLGYRRVQGLGFQVVHLINMGFEVIEQDVALLFPIVGVRP